jgi:hypothetical protein
MTVLAHPMLQQLRVLHMSDAVDETMMRLIAQLSSLHSLSFHHVVAPPIATLLPSCPSLTALKLHDFSTADTFALLPLLDAKRGGLKQRDSVVFTHDQFALLPYAAKCAGLKHLAVSHPLLYGRRFIECFRSPNLQRLESLELEHFSASKHDRRRKPIPPADFIAAFQALRCLHSLTLVQWNDVDDLLPHLVHAPALRSLTLQPDVRPGAESSAPSLAVLRELLASTGGSGVPLLCVIRLQPRAMSQPQIGWQAAQRLTGVFSALVDDMPARFRIVWDFDRSA